jgi:hypothetical protein
VAVGLYCTPLIHDEIDPITLESTRVDMTVEDCVAYCDNILGDDLVSVHTEREQAGHCCCHHTASCQCLTATTATEGKLEVAMVGGVELPGDKCPSSLVYGGYVQQCRQFDYWTENNPINCAPYLSENTMYYMVDTPPLDVQNGIFSPIAEIINNALNPTCAANVLNLLCNSFFRECKEAEENVWVPSLTCRGDCAVIHDIWENCVEEINGDLVTKTSFNSQMVGVSEIAHVLGSEFLFKRGRSVNVGGAGLKGLFPATQENVNPFRLFDCDAPANIDDLGEEDYTTAFLLGSFPANLAAETWRLSLDFPAGLDNAFLYPIGTVAYTTPKGDEYEVDCFNVRLEYEIKEVECFAPYVVPLLEENEYKKCVKPCPSPAYSNNEYSTMWFAASSIAMVGLMLNTFMATTFVLGGKRFSKSQPFATKVCVLGGLLYGIIDTLPTLFLKYDLACEDSTEEFTGTGALCALNRLIPF